MHNSTDLSAITLSVHASDPHSGLERLDLIVGTTYLSEDVAHKTKGVQRLVNVVSVIIQVDYDRYMYSKVIHLYC